MSAVQYSDVIRERFRRPRFRGRLVNPDAAFEDVNPLCGDRIRMHHGDSCAICAASADVLIEMAVGRPVTEVAELAAADVLERLQADIRPTRMKCVTLPITVLQGALDGREVAR